MKRGTAALSAVATGVALSAVVHGHGGAASGAARKAIAYAEAQIGKPYVWGGPTKPGTGYGFDCSGLVWAAYRHAGITVPRTSQAEWAALPHIPASQRKAGDLELIVGGDGTWAAPGHVVLLISRNKAVEAYVPGTDVRVIDLRNPPPGDQNVVGFADPAGG